VTRWAWRLFRREWRQQFLILALVTVAVAATVVGSAAATNSPPPAHAGFGTAQYMATFNGGGPGVQAQLARIEQRAGRSQVIENRTEHVPGSVQAYDLRSQDPRNPLGAPLLDVVSGREPARADEVALTPGLAATLHLSVGDTTAVGGRARRVVGIVQNPVSLLDEFALVVPGQVTGPTTVTVLFDAAPRSVPTSGAIVAAGSAVPNGGFDPETIVLALATVGMLLIALVSVGGFTVLAQRRLRSIGMIEALGATDRNVRRVVRANGVVVGVVGALAGFVLGLAAWLAYRPHLEHSAHHLIPMFAVPWVVVVVSMALAVLATYLAASRPARAVTRVPIVAALSGRPAPPPRVHRSALPGVVCLVIAFFLLSFAGSQVGGQGGGKLALVLGLVLLVVAVVLIAPLTLALAARAGRRAPVGVRLALRDLTRYRSRSGSALAAITLGVLIAVIICVVAAARYGDVLDYAGPNLASNQLLVYGPPAANGPNGPGGPSGPGSSGAYTPAQLIRLDHQVRGLAQVVGGNQVIPLETTSAGLQHAASGRQWNGPLYVATPGLLHAFGITGVDPSADVLSMRPGLPSVSDMQLIWGDYFTGSKGGPAPATATDFPCHPNNCLADPVIQSVPALPAGTSAPNSVLTEHAVHRLGLDPVVGNWLIQADHPLSAAQLSDARAAAASDGLTVESKNDEPTSSEVIDWATVFGIALALGVLAMSVGLIRSEAASDLRILAAAGAGARTRRAITAATAAALGLLGAVIGTAAGYLGVAAFLRSNQLDTLSSLGNVPVQNLLLILVGMPLVAGIGGWLLAGRQPQDLSRRPME
jgi:putative ABC transport system permease protein